MLMWLCFSGAQQLTCSVEGCGMALRCSADREKHEKEHQTRIPPTCHKCGELCPNKDRLRKHLVGVTCFFNLLLKYIQRVFNTTLSSSLHYPVSFMLMFFFSRCCNTKLGPVPCVLFVWHHILTLMISKLMLMQSILWLLAELIHAKCVPRPAALDAVSSNM